MTKTVSLYNESLTLHFNNNARNRYIIEEMKHAPVGVTSVLGKVLAKPALMLWPMNEALKYTREQLVDEVSYTAGGINKILDEASKAYTKKSDKGKDVGSLIHAAIEAYLLDEEQEVPKDAQKPLESFKKWFEKLEPTVLDVERIIYSKNLDYAGTFDSLLEIDGKTVLCDVKSTNSSRSAPNGIYPEMFLQLGAYSYALHEEDKKAGIQDLMIIRVSKTGELNTLRASELGMSVRDCEDAWLHVLNTYKVMTPLTKRLEEYANN